MYRETSNRIQSSSKKSENITTTTTTNNTKPLTHGRETSTLGIPTVTMTALLLAGLCFLILVGNRAAAAEEENICKCNKNQCPLDLIVNQAVQLKLMENQLQQQSSQLQQQTKQLQQHSERFDQLQQLSSQQNEHWQQLQSQVSLMEGVQEDNSASIVALNASSHPKQAAFSVRFTGSIQLLNTGEKGVLKFDTIVTNIGDAYSTQTGKFTAPYAGVYAFFSSLRSSNTHGWIGLGIYRGSTRLVFFTADGSNDHWDRGVNLATTRLEKGEEVFVRQDGGSTYLEKGGLTTFSGMLLAAD